METKRTWQKTEAEGGKRAGGSLPAKNSNYLIINWAVLLSWPNLAYLLGNFEFFFVGSFKSGVECFPFFLFTVFFSCYYFLLQ